MRTCLVEEWAFAETILKHFSRDYSFRLLLRKSRFSHLNCFHSNKFGFASNILACLSVNVYVVWYYIINIVTGIINGPRKLWLPDIMEFALSTFRARNFITFLAWFFRGSVDIALTGQLYDKLVQPVYF